MDTTTHTPRSLIDSSTTGLRVDWITRNRCTVYTKSEEGASDLSKRLCESGLVTEGFEGHEYMRELGLIQHVYALRIGTVRLRIVSPSFPPRGQFSNLRELERQINA